MLFFYSDPHYCHENIIKYSNRPFKDVNHMNEEMIKLHNSVVKENDTSICIGDFALSSWKHHPEKIVNRLNGKKILIRGNHDPKPSKLYEMGFNLVLENTVMYITGIGNVFFRHYPTLKGENLEYMLSQKHCKALVHGHIHNGEPNIQTSPYRVNVSVEMINYTPVPEQKLVQMIKNKGILNV